MNPRGAGSDAPAALPLAIEEKGQAGVGQTHCPSGLKSKHYNGEFDPGSG